MSKIYTQEEVDALVYKLIGPTRANVMGANYTERMKTYAGNATRKIMLDDYKKMMEEQKDDVST